jgi:FG-GAP repeat/IPT/TIG domain
MSCVGETRAAPRGSLTQTRGSSPLAGRRHTSGARQAGERWPAPVLALAPALAGALMLVLALQLVVGPRNGPASARAHRVAGEYRWTRIAPAVATVPLASQAAATGAYGMHARAWGFSAGNSAQRLGVGFDSSGVRVSSGHLWIAFALRAFGYGDALAPVRAVRPGVSGAYVSYRHGEVTEWYRNGPAGLEQGFTVRAPRPGTVAGPLTLALNVSGEWRARLSRSGRSVVFARGGAPALHYSGLSARDARGRSLHAWLELRRARLLILVDTRRASYPLQIDPWVQQAEALPGSTAGAFGASLAVSADGNAALVGAPEQTVAEDGQTKEGVAYMFSRSGSSWAVQGGARTRNGTAATPMDFVGGAFGARVALAADGATALIGSPESRSGAGLAWIFTRSGSSWSESARLANNSSEQERHFGAAVALSADGSTAVVGAEAPEKVPAYVIFTRAGSAWSAAQRLEGVRGAAALSSDGGTLLIGATVFVRSGSTWNRQGAALAGSGEIGESGFGESVALSADGNTALIGGPQDNSCSGCAHASAGAVWVFTRPGSTWTQQGEKLTASGSAANGHFGESVALSGDGNTAVIGAPGNGRVHPIETGAAFVFTRSGSTWTQQRRLVPSGPRWSEEVEAGPPEFGSTVALSSSGRTALVGATDLEGGWASVFVDAPSVSSVSPASGTRAGGTPVTLSGTGFTGASAVSFGPTSVSSFKVNSDTSISAVAPPGIGSVDVTVALPDTGPSPTGDADEFTYVGGPQLGRCVASARRKGEYKNSTCTKPAHGRGKDNWLPGAGAQPHFTSTLRAPTFELIGETRLVIACAAGQASGQYSGPHRRRVTSLTFSGCAESPSKGLISKCQTEGAANGEIVANELIGKLGVIAPGRKPAIGVDLNPATGVALASFECGGASAATAHGSGTGVAYELTGSVIGKVAVIDAMTSRNKVTYSASAGRQVPERFEDGLADTLTTLAGLQQTPEATTFSAVEEVDYEEPLEINAAA